MNFLLKLNKVQKLSLLLTSAIVLRLILMPFFMHMDLLSEYRRVNYAFENGEWFPGSNRMVTFWIELVFYSISQWFVVAQDVLLYLPNPEHSTSSTSHHFIFVGDSHVFRHIFLFKLPYLVFDLLAARFVWQYFSDSPKQMLATAFWLFNPVTIYATYFFGRFEVISLFFLIATALMFKKQKLFWAAIAFGLALNSREVNVLFLPAFFLAIWFSIQSAKISFYKGLLVCVPVLALWALPYVLQVVFGATTPFASPASVIDVKRGVSAVLDKEFLGIYPFFLLSAASLLWLMGRRAMAPEQGFINAALAVMIAFFILGFQSAHYFSWIIPFLVLAIYPSRVMFFQASLLILCWFCYWLLTPTGAYFSPLLATPIHESFFGWNTPSHAYQSIFAGHPLLDLRIVRKIVFTAAAACLLVMLVDAMKCKVLYIQSEKQRC